MENSGQKPSKPGFDKSEMIGLAMDLGYIIALPLVLLGLAGKWLDGKLGTTPWLTLAGIIIAIVLTTVWLTKKFKDYIK